MNGYLFWLFLLFVVILLLFLGLVESIDLLIWLVITAFLFILVILFVILLLLRRNTPIKIAAIYFNSDFLVVRRTNSLLIALFGEQEALQSSHGHEEVKDLTNLSAQFIQWLIQNVHYGHDRESCRQVELIGFYEHVGGKAEDIN